ncbi:MAG: hypothetical protein HQL80_03240 [Magnetococcales bacterium]|nr:hypothetical protein [Magnetococcales bacterium]
MSQLEADRTIHRHPKDGLPWLPAKTLTGIWRDACEQVALGLDNGIPSDWSRWVEILFGDQPSLRRENPAKKPVAARLSVREARLPSGLRHLLNQKENIRLKESLTFLKPGIRVNPETGTTLDDHLRTEEVARAGTVLVSEAIILEAVGWHESQKKQAVALLQAGTLLVERLGGKRRRGLGHCRWEMRDSLTRGPFQSKEELLLCLDKDASPLADTTPQGADETPYSATVATNGNDAALPNAMRPSLPGKWQSFEISLELLAPVVCAAATLGNVVESLDFIPGTQLLGAVAQRLAQEAKLPFEGFAKAVARGDLRLLDAHPEMSDGTRGQPVPHAIFYDKERGGLDKKDGKVWNRMAEMGPEHEPKTTENEQKNNTEQLKQHRKGYVSLSKTEGKLPPFTTIAMVPATHNVVEDAYQRPTEAVGGVYTYMAIAQGQTFRSRLLVRQEIANKWPDGWQNRIEGEIRLGRAKKDGYGRVRLSMHCTHVTTTGQEQRGGSLRLWLLSDCLIRDEWLRYSTQINDLARCVGEALSRLAGEQLGAFYVEVSGTTNYLLSSLLRTRRRESWHQQWGLPRPSFICFAAGSCIDFVVTRGKLTQELMRRLEEEGLGERRAEGFGEVACNHWLVMEPLSGMTASDHCPPGNNSPEGDLNDFEPEFARLLQKVAWRDSLARASTALAHRDTLEKWQENLPGNSQLGVLRGVLSSLRSWEDRGRLETWLGHLQEVPKRKKKWSESTLNMLSNALRDPEQIWTILEPHAGANAFPTILGESIKTIRCDLWGDALRMLWGAVIRREQRRREQHQCGAMCDQPAQGERS